MKQNENSEESKCYSKSEYSYSAFVRSLTLPDAADNSRIEASYEDGILKVDIAKKEEAKSVSRHTKLK